MTRLALALGRDPLELMREVLQQSEKCERKRTFWRDFLGRPSAGAKLAAWLMASFIALCALAGGGFDGKPGGLRRRPIWRA